MLCSIVVPCHSRAQFLRDTVRSLLEQKAPFPFEILVVDNSRGGAHGALAEEFPDAPAPLRVIFEPRLGLHFARHAGAREAKGNIVVYVDDDVIAPVGWLEAIVAPFQRDEKVAIVGGKVVARWEDEPPASLDFSPTFLSLLDEGEQTRELHWPEGVFGCNMAVRRKTIFEVKGFHPDGIADPKLWYLRGDGETGFHRKVFESGAKVLYVPGAWLWHRIPASRLERTSLQKRAFAQGVSDSFSSFRENPSLSLALFRLLREGARALKWSIPRWRDCRADAFLVAPYYFGLAAHQIRILRSPRLRAYVTRADFWK